jgi:hypothetical protein
MASTYVNDLRLNEMATGDASGSWGTVTNTNLELIGEAFSYGTETIGDADSTLTIADGAADAARSFYLKITSSVDLTTTRIVTLGPNTVSKVWMIENATTGSQVITIKQGSGATINVPNGQVKMISTDGAGSGGAVLDLLVDVDLTGTTTLVNLDVSGTALVTGVLTTTAATVFNGGFASNADSTLGTDKKVQFRDAAIYINSSVDGQLDIVADTEIQIAATTVDLNGALDVSGTLGVTGVLTATSLDISGDIDVDGTTNLDVVDIDGAVDMASTLLVTGVLTTTAATVSNGGGQFNGTVTVGVDDTGYDVKFFGATTGKSLLWDESADSLIITGSTSLQGGLEVGVDDTGYDVKFFGATAGAYMLWDESADDLILGGAAGLSVNTITDASGGSTASINGLTPQASNMQPFNRIINGAMIIDQRNAGASFTPINTQYTVDRWWTWLSQSSKLTAQQNAGAVLPPAGFATYLGITSSSAYSVAASDYFALVHPVEAINFYDLDWGKATAKPATLSFWVYSSLTGTFGGALANSAQNRSYPFTYSISVADTWEYKTVTIEGDTGGTWLGATNGIGVRLQFGLGVGADNSQTAGSWYGSNSVSATGSTSVVGTSGATFYITGVQLEAGSVATPFERRPYGTELALCQRYYWKNKPTNLYAYIALGRSQSTYVSFLIQYPQVMRAAPTFNYSNLRVEVGTLTTALATYAGDTSALYQLSTTSGATIGQVNPLQSNSANVGFLEATAEL